VTDSLDKLSLLAVLLFAGAGVIAANLNPGDRGRAVRPLAVAGFAVAVLLSLGGSFVLAAVVAVAAFIGLLAYEWRQRGLPLPAGETLPLRLSRVEAVALAGVLVLAVLLRFVALDDFPATIHGEENIWTWTVATALFSDERPWPIDWYMNGVPVSYGMEWPFFKIFGLEYVSARYAVAFFGTAAVVLMFPLARAIAGTKAALVATLLLATSIAGLAASRGAFVQSYVLFWTVLTVALYVYAVERRSPALFLLTGLAIVAGALTYQTYITIIPVIGLHFLYVAFREWRTRPDFSIPRFGLNGALLFVPLLAGWSKISAYLDTQRGHVTSSEESLTGIEASFLDAPGDYIEQVWENLLLLLRQLFHQQTIADFLVVRHEGPILLAGVTALALAGLAVVLTRLERRWFVFLVLWLAVQLGFSPLWLGSPYLRALLPVYPAAYVLAGIGLVAVLDRVQEAVVPRQALAAVAAAVLVAVFGVASTLTYFEETDTTLDGEIRSSMVEAVEAVADGDTRVLFPYTESSGDWPDAERGNIRFLMAGRSGGFAEVDKFYAIVPKEELLTEAQQTEDLPRTAVLLPSGGVPVQFLDASVTVGAAILGCYPAADRLEFGFWRVLLIEDGTAQCDATLSIEAQTPEASGNGDSDFAWRAPAAAGPFQLVVQRKQPGVTAHEMEAFSGRNGWDAEARNATGFTGEGYLFDNVTAGEAVIPLEIGTAGEYMLWFRTYRRAPDETHRYISLNGSPPEELSRPGEVPLEAWVWQAFGPFSLPAGESELRLSRTGSGPALFIDSLYLSSDLGFDPNSGSLWLTVLETTVAARPGEDHTYRPAVPLPPSEYRWYVTSLAPGVVDGLGGPLTSEPVEFQIGP
jgi:hypothetical protein